MTRMARRLQSVRVDSLAIGDVLWSSASESALRIISVEHVEVAASGNLLGDRDELGAEKKNVAKTTAIALRVQRATDGQFATLGAYAPHTLVQRLRYVPA